MTFLEAIFEGIIQGATEFLPVSSSGHLSLSKHFLGISVDSLLFDVMLHIGTLIAVLVVYHDIVWRLICAFFRFFGDVFKGRFKWRDMDEDTRLLMMLIFGLVPLFLLFIPIPGTGMKIKDLADKFATDNDIIVEGCSLILTSILLTLGINSDRRSQSSHRSRKSLERIPAGGKKSLVLKDALTIGLVQCVAAVFPGLSRSGSTLSTGLMRGINRKKALDYSFILGIPSIIAAALLTLKDATAQELSAEKMPMIVGMITACIVGFIAIKLLRWMVSSNKLHVFVFYTLILGIAVVVIGIIEHSTGINIISGKPLGF